MSSARTMAMIGIALACAMTATAQPTPATAPPVDATCGAALTAAAQRVGRSHRAFRRIAADVLPPIDLPARRTGPNTKPMPPIKRHAWGAHWSLQGVVPEYFYVDAVSVQDDGGAWSAVADTGTWQCTTTRRGAQRNHDCVIRGGDRLLIVRAIAWRDSARVTAFLDEFRAAAPACVP